MAPTPAPAPSPSLQPPADLPRGRLWTGLLAAALVLTVALQLWLQRGRGAAVVPPEAVTPAVAPADTPAVTPAVAPAGAAASAALGAAPATASAAEPSFGKPAEAAARVGRAASAALATARAAAGLAPPPPAEQVLDLCGLGRLTVPAPPASGPGASFEDLPRPLGLYARQQAWARLLPLMEQPGQPERVRAAALALRSSGLLDLEANPAAVQAAVQAARQAPAALPPAVEADTRALARLARQAPANADPWVVHWALAACARTPQTAALPECRRIGPRDLVRVLPQDAQAWLLLAATPGLPAAERDQALDRAAAAPEHGTLPGRLPLALDSVWPASDPDWPDYLRLQLLVQAVGVDVALAMPLVQRASQPCSEATLASPAGRARCEAIARQLQTHARSLLDLGLARGLGRRLGWSEAELAALQAETDRLQQAVPGLDAATATAAQPYSCAAVTETRQWLQAVARDGELAELRRRASQPTTPRPPSSRP